MTMQIPAPIEAPSAIEAKAARAPRASPCVAAFAPDVVLRRYAAFADLSADDVALLRSLAEGQSSIAAGQELECEGEPSRAPRLILSGWACRFRMLADGRRMIVTFLLPGDAICSRRGAPAPAGIVTCSLGEIAPVVSDAVTLKDPANNMKLAKSRSTGRIDAASASVLAVGEGARRVGRVVKPGREATWA